MVSVHCICPDSINRAIIVAVMTLGDPSQMPAIADLKWHAAAYLPFPVGRSSLDLPVDHHHRGEADEILLFALIGDQTCQRGPCWALDFRRPVIAGIECPACQETYHHECHERHNSDDEPSPEHLGLSTLLAPLIAACSSVDSSPPRLASSASNS